MSEIHVSVARFGNEPTVIVTPKNTFSVWNADMPSLMGEIINVAQQYPDPQIVVNPAGLGAFMVDLLTTEGRSLGAFMVDLLTAEGHSVEERR